MSVNVSRKRNIANHGRIIQLSAFAAHLPTPADLDERCLTEIFRRRPGTAASELGRRSIKLG